MCFVFDSTNYVQISEESVDFAEKNPSIEVSSLETERKNNRNRFYTLGLKF